MTRRTLLSFLAMAPFAKAAVQAAPVPQFTAGGFVGVPSMGVSEVQQIVVAGEGVLSRQAVDAIVKAVRNNEHGMRTQLVSRLNRP